jgi:fatty-acid desaturase
MKIYNVIGFAIFALCAAASALFAPDSLGPWAGLGIGILYFLCVWFLAGGYLSDVIHMGLTHSALDYQMWFVKTLVLLNNTIGIYINPVSWVNRHRNHHRFADHAGDPNKLSADGYPCGTGAPGAAWVTSLFVVHGYIVGRAALRGLQSGRQG